MFKKRLKKTVRFMADNLIPQFFVESYYREHLIHKVKGYPRDIKPVTSVRKVLQVNTVFKQGGAARVSYGLSRKLRQRGIEVNTAVAEPSDESAGVIGLKDNLNLKEFLLNLSARNKGWLDFANLSSFGIIKRSAFLECDLVHLHNLHGNYFNPFVLPEMTALKPTVWTLHDMQAITGHCAHSFECERWQTGCGNCPDLNIYPAVSRDETAFLWEVKRKIYDMSDLVIVCPSNWLKEKVTRSILREKEVHLIYNGIDTEIFKKLPQIQARERLGLPKDKKILLFSAVLGSDNPWKGGSYLRSAYELLKNREGLLFLNIGGGQKPTSDLSNWRDIPYIHDEETMALYYAAADLLAYPSLADNCPLVVLEAMACGLPVVSFKTGGIPEIISHGEDGYLAEYKNEQDFVRGLLCFLDNHDLLNRARSLAPQKISAKFSLDKMTDTYVKLYEKCCCKESS